MTEIEPVSNLDSTPVSAAASSLVSDAQRLPVHPDAEPSRRALYSVFVPGLGQFAQGRYFTGAGHLTTVLAYSGAAWALGGGHALWLAIAWNIWSAIDAYRHDRP